MDWIEGRLQFILECIDKDRPPYKTDIKFLETSTKQLDQKIKMLQNNTHVISTSSKQKKHPKTLLSDEYLDEIIARKNTKITKIDKLPTRKKKSFLRLLFSR